MLFTYKYTQLSYMWMLNSENICILYLHEFSYIFFQKTFYFQKYLLTLPLFCDYNDWFDIFIIYQEVVDKNVCYREVNEMNTKRLPLEEAAGHW